MDAPTPRIPAPAALGAFQFFVLLLSIATLGAIAADTLMLLPREVSRIVQWVDWFACGAFFVDFVRRFRAAESKAAFMKFGWIDLLACVPNVAWLRYGRFIRVLQILRLLRGVRSLQRLFETFFSSREKGGLVSVGTSAFLLIVFASMAVLVVEKHPDSNIKTAGDAIWWSVTTVTTVGYGDFYPVTLEGRLVAMALMVSGVGLVSVLSGLVASLFLGQREDEEDEKVLAELRALRGEIAQLRAGKREAP
ncbi:MAG: ion transporter [Verrucomicrobia bacterium]|nr:ion transporter [Verrucomicrobiota bacterium]